MTPARISTALALLLLVAGTTAAQEDTTAHARTPPVDWLAPCTGEGLRAQAWCGSYRVYEDRRARSGRRIELNVAVLPARSDTVAPDPVFFFHGGPGAAATEAMGNIAGVLHGVRASRDLVFIDQRGTGSSHPLDCDASSDGSLQSYFTEFLEVDHVRRCLAQQDADVTLYTTPIAMDDIDEVRAALGYDKINIFGGSYGTRAGLIYLRRHSQHVRVAVLKGIAPTNMKNPLPFARAAERGLRAVFDACAVQPKCHAAYPNLERDWERAMTQFDGGAVKAHVKHHETGQEDTVTIPRGVFADGVRHILYTVGQTRHLPRIIHHAAQGDFSVFAQRELRQSIGFANMLSMGMFMTVTCSEDLRFITEEEIRTATDGTFLGDYRVRRQLAACEVWGRGDVGREYTDPVRVDTPVLLLSGVYDTASPYEGGDWVARYMPNSLHVIFPNESHGFANAVCEIRLITDFLESGTFEGLDTSCVQDTKRPQFVTDEDVQQQEAQRRDRSR